MNWTLKGWPAAPSTIQSSMRKELDSYSDSDANKLIEQIRSRYRFYTAPQDGDDKATLEFLGIRAQCKEFADRMVKAGGGKQSSYTPSGVGNADISPGMYAFSYKNGKPYHAAIITAVKWDQYGKVNLQLAESNWGSGWSNPGGQVPWSRTIGIGRDVLASGYYVVKTD